MTIITIIIIAIGFSWIYSALRHNSSNNRTNKHSPFSVLRSPERQGAYGEWHVSAILDHLPEEYHVINNVIIPNRQITTQIDHVVVSPYGIFVIETKNYKGRIFGTEKSSRWKETFKTTGSHYFNNPIKQNWGHVYALAEYLSLNIKAFKPIIVFSDRASLNVKSSLPVIYMSQLKEQIASYTQKIIPNEEVSKIIYRIENVNMVGTESGNNHVETVRAHLNKQKEMVQNGTCPRCGGDLVLRHGKYGDFVGCSNYPKCRYTHNL